MPAPQHDALQMIITFRPAGDSCIGEGVYGMMRDT